VWASSRGCATPARATNLGAILLFSLHGSVLWVFGISLGLANMAGGYLGSRMAVAKGSRFIRVLFLAVVAVLTVTLGYDVWVENIAPSL
jgi:uncharacterized membrane protein YfcA